MAFFFFFSFFTSTFGFVLGCLAFDLQRISLAIDGVPKEGLRIQDVLVRIAVLLLVSNKVSMPIWIHGV